MIGDEPKAAVESFRFPALTAEVTGAAAEPMEGDRRTRNLCGSSADASMVCRQPYAKAQSRRER